MPDNILPMTDNIFQHDRQFFAHDRQNFAKEFQSLAKVLQLFPGQTPTIQNAMTIFPKLSILKGKTNIRVLPGKHTVGHGSSPTNAQQRTNPST